MVNTDPGVGHDATLAVDVIPEGDLERAERLTRRRLAADPDGLELVLAMLFGDPAPARPRVRNRKPRAEVTA